VSKVRVYELAKELGLESAQLLQLLKDMGEFVRSASSPIEAPVERKIKEVLAQRPDLVNRPATREASTAERPVGQPGTGVNPSKPKHWPAPKSRPVRPKRLERGKHTKTAWDEAWFEDSDRLAWVAAGIYDPKTAIALIGKGLGPADMSERVQGRRIGERLASGEPLAVVLALRAEERSLRESS
jgi:hypothetical protein